MRNLERALGRLSREIQFEEISSTYETEPVGFRDQPWFLNIVCTGVTRLSPRGVLELAMTVEAELGRTRGLKYGPRTIDVDLLAYGERVVEWPDLHVPHPRMSERRFVLEPLVEVAPDWRHPVDGRSARDLLEDLDDDSKVRPYGPPPRPADPAPLT